MNTIALFREQPSVRRRFVGCQKWSIEELTTLRAIYPSATLDELKVAFPTRNQNSIKGKAQSLGVRRARTRCGPEEIRERKARWTLEDRAKNPEKYRVRSQKNFVKNRRKRSVQARKWSGKHIFRMRSYRLDGVTPQELARLWKTQRGFCALTGRKLDRTAEVDHKLPKYRGGTDHVSNLQWVCKHANQSKWYFTEPEFIALCVDVVTMAQKRGFL